MQPSTSSESKEDVTRDFRLGVVREKLRQDAVELWKPPYTTEDDSQQTARSELAARYAQDLSLGVEEVTSLLEELRLHALQRLRERDNFNQTGMATLRVNLASNKVSKKEVVHVEISLAETGAELKRRIAEGVKMKPELIKTICCGRVLNDKTSLLEQNVKNGAMIMAVALDETQAEAHQREMQMVDVMRTKKAAESLSRRYEEDDLDLEIMNQAGQPMKMDPKDKRALTTAMALHEKGKAHMKRKDLSRALLLLLEADKAFSECNQELISHTDNYGCLNLDISWCYLGLKNLALLPDASKRLMTCEQCFERSYGAQMERAQRVQGGVGYEQMRALFVRLHLLQGVVAFHQNQIPQCKALFDKTQMELASMMVDDKALEKVMLMGYEEREARLGLRACQGNIQAAVNYIMQRRTEKEEQFRQEAEDRIKRKKEKKLGKTRSGQWVNVDTFDTMVKMGYPPGAACEALKRGNNDLNQAVEILTSDLSLRRLPDPLKPPPAITDAMIAALVAMGYDAGMVHQALIKHNGDQQRAVDDLVRHGGNLPYGASTVDSQSSSSTSTSSSSASDSSPSQAEPEDPQDRAALKDLMNDIDSEGESYLDLTLEEEAAVLHDYCTRLASALPS